MTKVLPVVVIFFVSGLGCYSYDLNESAFNIIAQNTVEDDHVGLHENDEILEKLERTFDSLPVPNEAVSLLKSSRKSGEMSSEEYKSKLQNLWDERQAELREAMDAIADEGSIMRDLMVNLLDASEVDSKKNILLSLEDMVQDVDKAMDFVGMGGMELLGTQLGDVSILPEVCFVIGTSSKHNPVAQDAGKKTGVLSSILSHLKSMNDYTSTSQRKLLYAAGSLIRENAGNQIYSAKAGLFDALSDVLMNSTDTKVAHKAATLIGDLLTETHALRAYISVENLCEEAVTQNSAADSCPEETKLSEAIEDLRNILGC